MSTFAGLFDCLPHGQPKIFSFFFNPTLNNDEWPLRYTISINWKISNIGADITISSATSDNPELLRTPRLIVCCDIAFTQVKGSFLNS